MKGIYAAITSITEVQICVAPAMARFGFCEGYYPHLSHPQQLKILAGTPSPWQAWSA
jgi:hypothetical protein